MPDKNNITLYKGNSFEKLELIEDNSVDAVITNPPYNTTRCEWDKVIDFEKLWLHIKRIIKSNAPVIFFGQQPSTFQYSTNIYRFLWQPKN